MDTNKMPDVFLKLEDLNSFLNETAKFLDTPGSFAVSERMTRAETLKKHLWTLEETENQIPQLLKDTYEKLKEKADSLFVSLSYVPGQEARIKAEKDWKEIENGTIIDLVKYYKRWQNIPHAKLWKKKCREKIEAHNREIYDIMYAEDGKDNGNLKCFSV